MNTEQMRLIIAVSLSALVLFTWQIFFAPKENRNIISNQPEVIKEHLSTVVNNKEEAVAETVINNQESNLTVTNINIEGNNSSFNITNELVLVDAKGAYAKNSVFSTTGNAGPIEIYIVNDNRPIKLNFDIKYDEKNNIYHGNDLKNGVQLTLKPG